MTCRWHVRAATWLACRRGFPYGSPKNTAHRMVGCVFYAIRESKGAGVNDVPVARQSRDLARLQARIPVRVTRKHSSPNEER